MEPGSEEIVTMQTMSGASIITDLCNRVADKLARSGDLRSVDAYRGYSAKVEIELQLLDVDRVEVSGLLAVGTMNPDLPSRLITVGESASADEVQEEPGAGAIRRWHDSGKREAILYAALG